MDYCTGLPRRQVIASAAAMGLCAATTPAFTQSTPKSGGALAIGIEGATTGDTLDPRTFDSRCSADAAGKLFNMLDEVQGPANDLKPGLASMTAEGTKLTFELTNGNHFPPAMLSNDPLCIMPEGTTTFDGVGSGPYEITRFSPDKALISRPPSQFVGFNMRADVAHFVHTDLRTA